MANVSPICAEIPYFDGLKFVLFCHTQLMLLIKLVYILYYNFMDH